MHSVDICRPLGAGEQSYWLRDRAHPLHFALIAQIKGQFTVYQLQQALSCVQQRHPLLRVRIVLDEAERPWFAFQPACIPLRVVQRQSENHWQREVEQEIATPFVWSQAPLVRVVLVHSSNDAELSELIVLCHHSIADGISVTNLIRDILQAIGTPTAFRQSLPVPASREDLIEGKTLKAIFLSQPIPKFKNDSFLVEQPARQNHRSFVSSGSLSPETMRSLIVCCHQEKTSVHAAICAAFLLAICHQNHSQQPQNLSCSSPINLRPYLTSVNYESFSLCVALERTSHQISSNTNLWDIARSIKYQLNQSITLENLFEQISQNQKWLSTNPNPDNALQVFKDRSNYDLTVSNLTRLTIEQQFGELELEAIYGPVVTTGVDNERLVGVVTLGERLFYTLICSEELILHSESKTLHEEAIHLLNEAVAANFVRVNI